ncbi:MAG: PIN domain-containing protein [Methylococcales bacterium]|nr:PIN domain-containing protein [Methylococcales bacterium]
MPGRIFIDTNIVIYALGQASTKAHLAAPLFVGSPSISTQVLSETANVASKRLGLPVSETRKLITLLEAMCRVEIISLATIHTALDIRERYGFSWYDSLIIAAALESGCDTHYFEDMQNSQFINGRLRIVNPFV